MIGCIIVILLFKKSTNMEAAYGLAIVIDMLMTSLLLGYLLVAVRKKNIIQTVITLSLFVFLEIAFLISNFAKLPKGGWFSLLIAFGLFSLLYLFYKARLLRQRVADYVDIKKIVPILNDVVNDEKIPYLATNLVYPARAVNARQIDKSIEYSLFRMYPKKAKVYWFVHINTTTKPRGIEYTVDTIIPESCFFINVKFGFKEEHYLESLIKEINDDLVKSGEIDGKSIFTSINRNQLIPDFKYIVLNTRLTNETKLSGFDILTIRVYRFIKSIGLSSFDDFGLDNSNTIMEYIPIEIPEHREEHEIIRKYKKTK
jgi:KUP system potassium uptake protein